MTSHQHTADCCQTKGLWCTKTSDNAPNILFHAIYERLPEPLCIYGLSQMIGLIDINTMSYSSNFTLLHWALAINYIKFMEALLANGAAIEAITSIGRTPLHLSAKHHSVNITRILVEHGANIHAMAGAHETVLVNALLNYNHRTNETCKYLLENGADVHIGDIGAYLFPVAMRSVLVAYGFPITRPIRDLPLYLQDAADGAFSRRKTAIRWWFYRHP
jgi:hypothetical protein